MNREGILSGYQYDLVVIGSGPAGEKGAAQAAYFGKKVAMIEAEPVVGGAAANTGTLPSKTLRETALMLSGFRARGLYGVDLSIRREVKVRDFLHREKMVKETERGRIIKNLERHRVNLFQGFGSFVDPHTIRVTPKSGDEETLTADKILIATGSSPRTPEMFPFAHARVWDSNEILQLEFMPKTMAVVGGGVIGSEYACTFAALGVQVFLIDGRDKLLTFLDGEISNAIKNRMVQLGIEMVMPEQVKACSADDKACRVTLESGRTLDVDAVLVAAGRVSNTGKLNLQAAGVDVGERGLLKVNEYFQTNVEHIYAAGDVIGFPALASTSMEQARLAMVHAFQLGYKTEVSPILPFGIYTIPEVSMAGETEESLRAKKIDFVAGRASYGNNPRGEIIGDYDSFLKLLFRRSDMKLLGVHVIGEQATELVHIGLAAMLAGASSDLFIRACFNYPTLGDLYKYATYDAMGQRD